MNFLNRIPIWGWYVFTTAFIYALWNPTSFSLTYFILFGDSNLSVRILTALVIMAVLSIYVLEAKRTLNTFGLSVLGLIILAVAYVLIDYGVLNGNNVGTSVWWMQPIIAAVLTIGLQGSKVYRNMTGRVSVSTGQEGHTDSHHGHN